jgi:hypothetical protein
MACRTCGSDWLSVRGHDCLKCPYCNKVARCAARKQGRWVDPVVEKSCKRCGDKFQAVGLSQAVHRLYCKACSAIAIREWKKEYSREYDAKVRSGEIKSNGKRRRALIACGHCGEQFPKSSNNEKYCSSECFHAARNAGTQPCDRSSLNAMNIELQKIRSFKKKRDLFLQAGASLQSCLADLLACVRKSEESLWSLRQCLACSRCFDLHRGKGHGKAYCSRRCADSQAIECECTQCGKGMSCSGLTKKPRCKKCRKGCTTCANNRQRCRLYGVPYQRGLTRKFVLERDDYKCYLCGRQTKPNKTQCHPRYPTVDHVVPLAARIYGHVEHNVRCACRKCNEDKCATWDGQLNFLAASFETPTG